MEIFKIIAERVQAANAQLVASGAIQISGELPKFVVEPTRDPSHGDISSNTAMVMAKLAGMKPHDLAKLQAEILRQAPEIEKAEIAGPGFINLTLKPAVFTAILKHAVEAGLDYGRGEPKPLPKINVEYVSANPTGPMHVGHGRGAVFGDALANILAFAGHAVTREYYINDAGAQVDVLARSAFLRYREALGETITIPEGLYPGDYLVSVGQALAARAWRCASGQAGGRMAAAGPRCRDRRDDGDDPRGSGGARRRPRGVLFRALAAGRGWRSR